MELVWRERRVYYLHRYKARRYPSKYLTIIDDAIPYETSRSVYSLLQICYRCAGRSADKLQIICRMSVEYLQNICRMSAERLQRRSATMLTSRRSAIDLFWSKQICCRSAADLVVSYGMDQKTTCIPRVRRKTKATCNLATVGTHLVGAIFHSGQSPHGKDVSGSFDYYQWSHDRNLTGSVLLTMLARWCEKYKLPPVLYLQLDNCVKENKNQFILWLLGYLVEFREFLRRPAESYGELPDNNQGLAILT
ncbi:uncharacterized protein LOC141887204 [Acropora palmata]|uniref:uncharacterized protein LOC141887204 n=1 Tax=Acropora palmata TaxID=6131 RepID=UPI003DA1AF72